MRDDFDTLSSLALHFSLLSLLAVGGGLSALPEIHRQAVEVSHWIDDRQFTDLVAIAQASPGPNIVIVTLIGHHVAGFIGALVATFFMCVPTCALAYAVSRVFDRFKYSRWRIAVQSGLVPVSIGLIAASALIVARSADHDWTTVAVTAVSAAWVYWTRATPLIVLGAAAVLGYAGLIG
ncbi:MAG TPA: chromate transporter [Xanthobacteraceae bacterium]|jgi:chromate transporter|nr:chromate transporter [Xanthobacteraceae bacterium]